MNSKRDYHSALALRLQGKTYGEIKTAFGIPKSTLSTWFREIKLPEKAKAVLLGKRNNGYLALQEFNKTRTEKIKRENEKIIREYQERIGKISRRELLIIGAMLYWGEGYKNFREKAYVHLCFANSDPAMIKVFMRFLDKVLDIKPEHVKAEVMLYPNLGPKNSVNYWQRLTKIPKSNFRFYVALSRASKGKHPRNSLPYGTLQLQVKNRRPFFKVRGLIDGVIQALI